MEGYRIRLQALDEVQGFEVPLSRLRLRVQPEVYDPIEEAACLEIDREMTEAANAAMKALRNGLGQAIKTVGEAAAQASRMVKKFELEQTQAFPVAASRGTHEFAGALDAHVQSSVELVKYLESKKNHGPDPGPAFAKRGR